MTAVIHVPSSQARPGQVSSSPADHDALHVDEDRAKSRFAARRACAAARADVSQQESEALLRAAAESAHQQRREKAEHDRAH